MPVLVAWSIKQKNSQVLLALVSSGHGKPVIYDDTDESRWGLNIHQIMLLTNGDFRQFGIVDSSSGIALTPALKSTFCGKTKIRCILPAQQIATVRQYTTMKDEA
jgi:hypothetical protein